MKLSDEFKKTPLGCLDCYEDIRNYFFDLMAVEISRAIKEEDSNYASKIQKYVNEIDFEPNEDMESKILLRDYNEDLEIKKIRDYSFDHSEIIENMDETRERINSVSTAYTKYPILVILRLIQVK